MLEDRHLLAAGALDSTFGTNGIVTTDFFSASDEAHALALQSDGKIVVAGRSTQDSNTQFAVTRYDTDGSLDDSFGTAGKVTTSIGPASNNAEAIGIQSDGKIVVVGNTYIGGNFDVAIVRYNSDGTLDTTFGTGGKVATDVNGSNDWGNGIAFQSDGKIVISGQTIANGGSIDFLAVRYNADGSLDTTFDVDGIAITDFGSTDSGQDLVIQPDGKIVVAGYASSNFALARYNSNGSLDTSFDGDGKAIINLGGADFGHDVILQADGKFVVAGRTNANQRLDFGLARFNSDGSPDTSFGTNSIVTTDFGSDDEAFSLALDSAGRIIAVGEARNGQNKDFALARYNSNGTLDTTFGTDGKVTTAISAFSDIAHGVIVQSDGKIVVAGLAPLGANSDFAVVRYTGDTDTNDTQGLTVTPTTVAVDEGGTNTFAVTLTAQPTSDVTVTTAFASGDADLSVTGGATLTFTNDNWNVAQNVTLGAAEDADAVNGSATFTVSSVGLTSVEVTANEVDNDTQALVVDPTTVNVSEGGTNTFTVKLAAQPTGNVTVNVAHTAGDTDLSVTGGATLTFTISNWNVAQEVTLSAAEDDDAVNGSATITVSSSGLTSVEVTANEVDNDTQALVVDPTTVNVSEGGTNTFTVKLAAQPTGNVTVNVAHTAGDTDLSVTGGATLTFTSSNWNVAQEVTLAAAEDDDAVNGSATITVSSSGLTSVEVTANEVDNDTQALVVDPTTVNVSEGGTSTFTVKLAAQPTGNVTVNVAHTAGDTDLSVTGGATLTFTISNWNVAQEVTLSAAEDDDAVNGSATITVSSSGLTSVEVTANEVDNDTQALVVDPTTVNVSEGETSTFTVKLAAQPTGNVTVNVAHTAGDTDLSVTGGATLTFTISNWNDPQTVTLSAAEDDDTVNGSATITVSSAGLTSVEVTANEVDNDTQALVVDPTTVNVSEGGTNTFTVKLAAQPTDNVTVSVAHTAGDTDLSVTGGATLTFNISNWNDPQTVTLSAAEDDDAVNGSATITVSSAGLTSVEVTANEVDNDTQALVVDPTTVNVSEGGTNTFTVKLAAQPTGDVTVNVAHTAGDTDLSVTGGATLTFTISNWNDPQTVTLAAAEDDDTVNGSATFTVSSVGLSNVNVTANEVDDDTAGFSISESDGNTTVSESGTTDTFTVVLLAAPLTDVVLTIISGDTGEVTVSPATLTFTPVNWSTAQIVTVTGVDDSVVDGNQTTIITISIDAASSDEAFHSLADQTVSVTTTDNDGIGGVTIESISLSSNFIMEGDSVIVSGTFSHPALGSMTVEFTGAAMWSDGVITDVTVDSALGTFSTAREFPDDDPSGTPSDVFTVNVTIADDGGQSDTKTSSPLTVNNVAPEILDLSSSNETLEGKSDDGNVTIHGSFADVGLLDTHVVIVDWGDGSDPDNDGVVGETLVSVDQMNRLFDAAHQYSSGGIYTITVTVIDDDGGSVTDTTTAVITGVGLVDGTLYVIGTNGKDIVRITRDGSGDRSNGCMDDQIKVLANLDIGRSNRGSSGGFGRGAAISYFNSNDVTRIEIHLLDGDDHASIGDDERSDCDFDIPALIFGGDGNDHLTGGAGNDILIGGNGKDVLNGRGGNDILVGGAGDDQLDGGDGDDLLIGGDGKDKLRGNKGDDLLIGDSAANDIDVTALESALANWTAGDLAAALVDLGALVSDGDKDDLSGDQGDDALFGSASDKLKP